MNPSEPTNRLAVSCWLPACRRQPAEWNFFANHVFHCFRTPSNGLKSRWQAGVDMNEGPAPADAYVPVSFVESERPLLGTSELARLMRAFDWESTSIGMPDAWPKSLRTAVGIMLTSRQPIWIGWGRQLICLYNDAYKSIIGGKHPWALGKPASVVWREIWPDIAPMLSQAMEGNEGTYVEAQLLIMERNGYPEETYYTFSYSPIPGDDGTVGASSAPIPTTRSASSVSGSWLCCANSPRRPRRPAPGNRLASEVRARSPPIAAICRSP